MLDFTRTARSTTKWDIEPAHLSSVIEKGGLYNATRARSRVQARLRRDHTAKNPAFAAFIAAGEPSSGGYGGMSWVAFPLRSGRSLVGLVVGTQGLQPDELTLGMPGHARKTQAIARWLRTLDCGTYAWAKAEPVRTDRELPTLVRTQLEARAVDDDERTDLLQVADRYGSVLYALSLTPLQASAEAHERAGRVWLDLSMDARSIPATGAASRQAQAWRDQWRELLLPATSMDQVEQLLEDHRFVILEGPPGTGKTHLAERLLEERYADRGRKIQFHPATTYETFVQGLAPVPGTGSLSFEVKDGHLIELADMAAGGPTLLHIDEINRADLSKVLGEAILLFERGSPGRTVTLEYKREQGERTLELPKTLHVLGTMNSSDRSIALMDLAIRRRFAFHTMWPHVSGIDEDQALGRQLFSELVEVFVEHAPDSAFKLLPGHAYFRYSDEELLPALEKTLVPLLRSYIDQGLVAGFADEVEAWLDHLQSQR